MGLLPSKQLVDLLEPTPCLAQLMVQVQLSFSLLGCISLLHLLGQPARICRGTHPVSQGHAQANRMWGAAAGLGRVKAEPASKLQKKPRDAQLAPAATQAEKAPRRPSRRRTSKWSQKLRPWHLVEHLQLGPQPRVWLPNRAAKPSAQGCDAGIWASGVEGRFWVGD